MKRYFFEIAYDGTKYYGWQRQPNEISVQETIETVLSRLYSNAIIQITGCGRTDTGVHAQHYIFHVDLEAINDLEKFQFKLNRMLPDAIVIYSITEVLADKHARFSATSRSYRYFIHQKKDPFVTDYSWYLPQQLDLEAMNKAATLLIGTKDFTSFSKAHSDVKTSICTVTKARWVNENDGLYFEITADRFLRNMVRAIVGTLIDVGLKKITVEDIPGILAAKNRDAASISVPAHGLFLWRVEY